MLNPHYFMFIQNRFLKNTRFLLLSLYVVAYSMLLAGCSRSGSSEDDLFNHPSRIQKGNTEIQLNVIYPQVDGKGSFHHLQIRYNKVIESPIYLRIRFNLTTGGHLDLPVTIPAGYQHLQDWGQDNYLNIVDYIGGLPDDGTVATGPTLSTTLDIKSLVVTGATTPDKNYGFRVLGGEDNWDFYHPTDEKSTIAFKANNEEVIFSDYVFNMRPNVYNKDGYYHFTMPDFIFNMLSDPSNYPLKRDQQLTILYTRYYYHNRNYGNDFNDIGTDADGSTIKLNITHVDSQFFDAEFSGKIWSKINPDTLFITDGQMQNMPIPYLSEQ